MRMRWIAAAVSVFALTASGCLDAGSVKVSRDDCLLSITKQQTAFLTARDCRSVLGADWCGALVAGMIQRAARGQESEKLNRMFNARCQ